ncbi:MAG: ferredoxin [archaeon]
MAKLAVDQKTCIGCESCSTTCPNLFQVKDGKSKPKKTEISGDEIECAKSAAKDCPTKSITVSE